MQTSLKVLFLFYSEAATFGFAILAQKQLEILSLILQAHNTGCGFCSQS